MATATIEVPHVYTAIAAVLKHMSVNKNGVLPGNMGGKAYITAHDISAEVKSQFTKNDLIFTSNEDIVSEEHIIFKDRMNIRVLIKGTYQIISTRDGSSVTITGLGDGLATGTAVASNIGSTNALKNALLRTFLITEQAVEDGMMRDMVNAETTPTRAQAPAAKRVQQVKASAKAGAKTSAFQQKIVTEWIEPGKVDTKKVNAMFNEEKLKNKEASQDDLFKAVYDRLNSGETE